MNEEIKKRWVVALRSGEYKQCTDMLRDDGGFCCLGVLTDLYLKEHNKRWTVSLRFLSRLPARVIDWAGLNDNDPCVSGKRLSGWNDYEKADFDFIAGLIERSDL